MTMTGRAQINDEDYIVDKNGDVIIACIVDSLHLQKHEIYSAALKYMQEAYKDTKYKIVVDSPSDNVVAGNGEYLQFHEANFFPYSYFLNAPFTLRVEAKDNRARISITLSYYTGKRSNINETKDIHDRISSFQPIKEDELEHRKLYGKAFVVLYNQVKKTINEVAGVLKSTVSSESALDSDW